MRCAERRPDGPAHRPAIAAVRAGTVTTLLCGDCTLRADRLVPGLSVRWLDRRPTTTPSTDRPAAAGSGNT